MSNENIVGEEKKLRKDIAKDIGRDVLDHVVEEGWQRYIKIFGRKFLITKIIGVRLITVVAISMIGLIVMMGFSFGHPEVATDAGSTEKEAVSQRKQADLSKYQTPGKTTEQGTRRAENRPQISANGEEPNKDPSRAKSPMGNTSSAKGTYGSVSSEGYGCPGPGLKNYQVAHVKCPEGQNGEMLMRQSLTCQFKGQHPVWVNEEMVFNHCSSRH